MNNNISDSLDTSLIESKDDKDTTEDDKKFFQDFVKYLDIFFDKIMYQKAYYYTKLLKQINYKEIKEFFFCNSCKKSIIFYIEPKDLFYLEKMYYSCDCSHKKKEILFDNILALAEFKYKISTIEKYLIFPEQDCKEIFSYFSPEDKKNFCKIHINKIKNINDLNSFLGPSIYNQIIYLIQFIVDETNINNHNKEGIISNHEKVIKIKIKELKEIISITIMNFIKYPNFNLHLTIQNFYESFSQYSESSIGENEEIHFKKIIEINRNKRKLVHLKQKLYPFVKKIDLRQLKIYDDNNNNIKIFEILNHLENLIELNLSENCLYSIKSLLNAKCKYLKILKLSLNYLNDENIPHFKNLNFKELISLDLEHNNFTNYELFPHIFGNFQMLEEFKIGFNIFEEATTKEKKNTENNLKNVINELEKIKIINIKILCANNGVFNQRTVEPIISTLHLKNYDNVDIRYNNLNLSELKFIEGKINNKNKKLFTEGNYIKDKNEINKNK